MRLLSLTLRGQYKSLKDQTFSFDRSEGNIIAFIGLNGSGKSQLLELIAETFGYLERSLRTDFKCRKWFPNAEIVIKYTNHSYDSAEHIFSYSASIKTRGDVELLRDGEVLNIYSTDDSEIEQILPSNIIGYSSGLNENLQRAFMKNAIQYLDIMNDKLSLNQTVSNIKLQKTEQENKSNEVDMELFDQQYRDAYYKFSRRYPTVFPILSENISIDDDANIDPRQTKLPLLKYFDQDTTALMLVSMGMLSDKEQSSIWQNKQRFNKICLVKLRFDLRRITYDSAALSDVSKLIRCVGGSDSSNFKKLPRVGRTPEEIYNQYELDYLAGEITIDFTDEAIKERLLSSFFTPQAFFISLYRLQLLAAQFWQIETKRQLRQDRFIGAAKRPQKWKSPIQVLSLQLSDGGVPIEFEDLSDGEAQLIQILSMGYLYKDSRTLFLLDEPETHLNPSWRTYFHSDIEKVIGQDNKKVQFFISTHSPFMISSLKRNNVYQFHRNEFGLIDMSVVQNETYGASFDVLIKDLFELRSLISHSVIDEIRVQLNKGDSEARAWIDQNLGLSAEKAYLLRKLSQ